MYRQKPIMTRPYLQFFTNLWLGICLTFLISGCATTQPQPVPYPDRPIVNPQIPQPEDKTPRPVDEPEVENPDDTDVKSGLTPAFMDTDNIKRIAMILPFSSRSKALRAEADAMLKAAELSVFDNGDKNVLLIPIDGGGTQTGSRRAAQKAIEQGADIILGPIKASSVSAVGNIAARSHIPVIGFSNDMRAAGSGVFLLSFPPEAETRRIVDFAAEQGATKFAFLGPDSVYGRRVLAAYRDTITKTGGELTAVETYAGDDISVMQGPAERLARTYAQAREAALAKGETDPEPAFHAVLLPEKGTALRSLAPLLPYFDDS
ncbi:MAG TPA: hypothetical protein ENJ42_03885, partial [Hellea balneolensis]|nr:hypothetical protein [Hellea balneolensis]